jgi:hypothetical protein
MSNEVLKTLVASEGYCCIRGYIKLCLSRGETPSSMAEHMGVAASTITYNISRLRDDKRTHRCVQCEGCLKEAGLFDDNLPLPL